MKPKKKPIYCTGSSSPLLGTWFSKTKMPLSTVLKLTYMLVRNYAATDIHHELATEAGSIGSHTTCNWMSFV